MKIIRWIVGIILPFVTVICLTLLIGDSKTVKHLRQNSGEATYIALHFSVVMVMFTSLILMTCLIVPTPKKYGAIVSSSISYTSAIAGGYYQLFVINSYIGQVLLASYVGIFSGLMLGTYVSSLLFKNKGWGKAPIAITDIETY